MQSRASARVIPFSLWKYDIDFAPVVRGRRTLVGPVRRVVQMVRHLCGPATTQMAVKQVTLDRLAETGSAAGHVHFPPWREVQCASHRVIDLSFTSSLLKSLNISRRCDHGRFYAAGFAVDRLH